MEDFNQALQELRLKIIESQHIAEEANLKLKKVLNRSHLKTILTMVAEDYGLKKMLNLY